jgi:hypothetical protein
MAAQLTSQKRPGQNDGMEVRALSARAANAEARVKEYESRLKAAEERVKRERQGSKERVAEWEKDKIKKTPTLDDRTYVVTIGVNARICAPELTLCIFDLPLVGPLFVSVGQLVGHSYLHWVSFSCRNI